MGSNPTTETNEAERRRWNDERWAAVWPKRERLSGAITAFLLDAAALRPGERVLDVGCGLGLMLIGAARRLTTGKATGIDIWQVEDLSGNRAEATLENARREGVADRVEVQTADMRKMPFPDASFDVVLCTQVLEHSTDPAQAVRELARVTAPGGRVLASTHGTAVYHPAPNDFWRWTHTGLDRLFTENGDWKSVTVKPGAGTGACLGMLLGTYVDLVAQNLHARPLGYPFVWLLNGSGALVDRMSHRLREPVPGTIFANFHVTAEARISSSRE